MHRCLQEPANEGLVDDDGPRVGRAVAVMECASRTQRAAEGGEIAGADRRGPQVVDDERRSVRAGLHLRRADVDVLAGQAIAERDGADAGLAQQLVLQFAVGALEPCVVLLVRFLGASRNPRIFCSL